MLSITHNFLPIYIACSLSHISLLAYLLIHESRFGLYKCLLICHMLLNYSGSEGNKYQGTVLKIVFLILITDSAFYSN